MVGSESRYQAWLEARGRAGLRRGLTAISAPDARTIQVGPRSFINFASNDYLALRFHPALVEQACAWAKAMARALEAPALSPAISTYSRPSRPRSPS